MGGKQFMDEVETKIRGWIACRGKGRPEKNKNRSIFPPSSLITCAGSTALGLPEILALVAINGKSAIMDNFSARG